MPVKSVLVGLAGPAAPLGKNFSATLLPPMAKAPMAKGTTRL